MLDIRRYLRKKGGAGDGSPPDFKPLPRRLTELPFQYRTAGGVDRFQRRSTSRSRERASLGIGIEVILLRFGSGT
jgi:hypothetical protein